MKYNIYKTSNTIKKYKIKKNIFTKEYVIKVNFVQSRNYEYFKTKSLEEMQEYEQYVLDKMNSQMIDFVDNSEYSVELFKKAVEQNYNKVKDISGIVSLALPIILTAIFKDRKNLILYVPLIVINAIVRRKAIETAEDEFKEDIIKYQTFLSDKINFDNFSKYVTENKKPLTANTIDKYSLEQLQSIRNEVRNLSISENNLNKEKTRQLLK